MFPWKQLFRENWLPVVLGFAGLIMIFGGVLTMVKGSRQEGEITFETAATTSAKIKVDIAGAVLKPGVYELNLDSRLQDLLVASGGLSSEADREWGAKNLNLASKLQDGGKVYIPKIGENFKPSGSQVEGTNTGLININTGSAQELDKLPGVGPVTAQKIISNRPYQAIEELLTKKAVGKATFEKIKDQISVW